MLSVVSHFGSNWPCYNGIELYRLPKSFQLVREINTGNIAPSETTSEAYSMAISVPMFGVPSWRASITDVVWMSAGLAVLATRLTVLAVGSMQWQRPCALLDRVVWYVGTANDPWALVASPDKPKSLKSDSFHGAKFFVSVSAGGCRFDNLWCTSNYNASIITTPEFHWDGLSFVISM